MYVRVVFFPLTTDVRDRCSSFIIAWIWKISNYDRWMKLMIIVKMYLIPMMISSSLNVEFSLFHSKRRCPLGRLTSRKTSIPKCQIWGKKVVGLFFFLFLQINTVHDRHEAHDTIRRSVLRGRPISLFPVGCHCREERADSSQQEISWLVGYQYSYKSVGDWRPEPRELLA